MDVSICTDASTLHGLGGFTSKGQWFQFGWKELEKFGLKLSPKMDIFWMEMLAIVVSVTLYCREWKGRSIKLHCDNQACVESWKKKKVQLNREDVMVLIRMICEKLISKKTYLWIEWIEGKKNAIADGLSRFEPNALGLPQTEVVPPVQWRKSATPCGKAVVQAINRVLKCSMYKNTQFT